MPRKGRFEYDPNNTTPDGHYIVGKGRPPEHGKFRKGDDRKRGRRAKGIKNLATDLNDELENAVSVTVGGIQRKVTRQRAILMRMTDNAMKGQTSAIALTLEYQQKLVDPLHQRVAQQKESDARQDFSKLTSVELQVLCHLTGKAEGIDDPYPPIVGVIPIYAPGEYIRNKDREEVEAGLKAYGIEVVDFQGHFPPTCRLLSGNSDGGSESS